MCYLIFKYNPNSKHVVIVNDAEGIPMEWDNYESAEKIANLFQANTNHNCTYEVRQVNQPEKENVN